MATFRLRFTDPRKQGPNIKGSHGEGEAIEFVYNLDSDNVQEVAQSMFKNSFFNSAEDCKAVVSATVKLYCQLLFFVYFPCLECGRLFNFPCASAVCLLFKMRRFDSKDTKCKVIPYKRHIHPL